MRRVFEMTGTLARLSFATPPPEPPAELIARLRAALPALHHRDFALLFSGQAISVIGDALFPVALAFAVLELDGSPSSLGLVLAAQALPLALFALVGGVVGDRLSRQKLMLASDLARAAIQAVAAALLIAGVAEIWHLAVLAASTAPPRRSSAPPQAA